MDGILRGCNLWIFELETAKVFEHTIERLFYAETYRIGDSVLPRKRVRAWLHHLNEIVLQDALAKLQSNEQKIRNATAFTMAVVFNSICEQQADLLTDPYLNSLQKIRPPDSGGKGGGFDCSS